VIKELFEIDVRSELSNFRDGFRFQATPCCSNYPFLNLINFLIIQFLLSKELFHQSSFCWNNVYCHPPSFFLPNKYATSSIELLFQQRSCSSLQLLLCKGLFNLSSFYL